MDNAVSGIGIYKITFGNEGKCYIGQSKDMTKRFTQHLSLLKCGLHHNKPLQSAYNRGENVRFEVIESISPKKSRAYLCNREAEEIAKAGSKAVNASPGQIITLEWHNSRERYLTKSIERALEGLAYCYQWHDTFYKAMDGSETPETSPERRSYDLTIEIINNWIEKKEATK